MYFIFVSNFYFSRLVFYSLLSLTSFTPHLVCVTYNNIFFLFWKYKTCVFYNNMSEHWIQTYNIVVHLKIHILKNEVITMKILQRLLCVNAFPLLNWTALWFSQFKFHFNGMNEPLNVFAPLLHFTYTFFVQNTYHRNVFTLKIHRHSEKKPEQIPYMFG